MKIIAYLLLIVSSLSVIMAVLLYQKGTLSNTAVTTAVVSPTPTFQLPPNLVKVSECIPEMGEHWVNPADLPRGPFYVVYKGKVTAIEYMIKEEEIPGEVVAKMSQKDAEAFIIKNKLSLLDLVRLDKFRFPLNGEQYKSFDIHWSAPHAGFVEPHMDMHFYMVDDTELAHVCPDARLENVYTPELIKKLNELGIPIPKLPMPSGKPVK